jgi:hypothetical protein
MQPIRGLAVVLSVGLFLTTATPGFAQRRPSRPSASPIKHRLFTPGDATATGTIAIRRADAWATVQSTTAPFVLEAFPLPDRFVDLELHPFEVTSERSQFVLGRRGQPDQPLAFDARSISLFRGSVIGHPGSHVYLALSEHSSVGHVELGRGRPRFNVSSRDFAGAVLPAGHISVFEPTTNTLMPPHVPLCGVGSIHAEPVRGQPGKTIRSATGRPSTVGLKHLELAVDTDYEYFFLFDDELDATAYLVALYGAVSDIFMRDVNVRVELVYTRVWTDSNDLYNSSNPLPEFRDHWLANEGGISRDAAQLLSGRRDYPFGGQAYLSQLCNLGFSVVGYASGFFPDPTQPSPYNFDVHVTAHELAHNAGTGHTHDYGIDTCHLANTAPQRGPIMSYCGQTWSGMGGNTDNYFHAVVRGHITNHVNNSACIVDDCNMNGIADAVDISNATSADLNSNGTPDECEDCNNNSILDPADIAGGSNDANTNGIPDECEPDCNGNGVPDDRDIQQDPSIDAYGDGIPDECEADCNDNNISDYTEIQLNMPLDVNRDTVLDACQDCDDDGTPDRLELNNAHAVWVASGIDNEVIREFHETTGVLTDTSAALGAAVVREGQDVLVIADGHVLVSSAVDDRVLEFDSSGSYLGDVVTSGLGGIDHPAGLLLSKSGTLLVASHDTDSVLSYNLMGLPLGAFVAQGSGGVVAPFGLTFGPNGNLFVTSDTNEVIEYDGDSGAFVGTFVEAASNGGLDSPRGLTFKGDGNLLVASFGTDEVLEYAWPSGAPLGKWAQVGTDTAITQDSPWGIRVGPNGHVYVSRTGSDHSSGGGGHDDHDDTGESHLTDARMFEYNVCTGLFRKTHIGGNDHGLEFATGFDFVPGFAVDCNFNQLTDDCDIASGFSQDADLSGIPDECEVDCNGNGVFDVLDIIPHGSSFDADCNFVPDECLPCTDSIECDDGLFCNGIELCVGGFCHATPTINCDDGVTCTDDGCDETADACTHASNDSNCDDGLFCNGTESCDAILDCQTGTVVVCDDTVACTDDACNESTDQCDHLANDSACDDGLFCNGSESCQLAGCQSGITVDCDDSVDCTIDACNEGTDACDNTPTLSCPGSCVDTANECCDIDPADGIRDDGCKFCRCGSASCLIADIIFADMGGAFGECHIDGFVNVHDRNHVLSCFEGTSTCEALNIDPGGAFGDCSPDGFCNIHDANHALAAFAGTSSCSCPAGPAPYIPPAAVDRTTLRLVPSARLVHPGDVLDLRVFTDGPIAALRSYQLGMVVSGGQTGQATIESIAIESRRDGALVQARDVFTAVNVARGQVLAGLESATAPRVSRHAYLATYRIRFSDDASGAFVFDLEIGGHGQTVMIAPVDGVIDIDTVHAATVGVMPKQPAIRTTR